MPRIDPAQQLAFVEPEGDRVIGLPRARLPRRLLPSQHDREAIEVGDHAAIDRLVEREQPGLVRQQLADGDRLLALLRELGPVRGRPARRSRASRASGRAPGSSRPGPWSPSGRSPSCPRSHGSPVARVADAAPQVDDLLAAVIRAARAAQLAPAREVLGERVAHGLESRGDSAEDLDGLAVSHPATTQRITVIRRSPNPLPTR